MKLIRLPGLLAFIIIVALTSLLLLVTADHIILQGSKATLEKISGTQVDIATADLTLSPLGIDLSGIEITSSSDPMQNAVAVDQASFSLDTGNLLLRKVIVEDMLLSGVKTGTPRQRPGKIFSREDHRPGTAPKFLQEALLPSIQELDVREILENENLETLILAEQTRAEIEDRQVFWQQRLKELPDKPRITEYRRRLQKIKKTDTKDVQAVLKGTQDLNILKNDILNDINLLKTTRHDLQKDYATINSRVEQTKRAPANDIRRLKNKYGPSPGGAGNISRLIFGDKFATWTERTLTWYTKINPFLQKIRDDRQRAATSKPPRAKGLDVHFPEDNPLPDFLIRQARVSAVSDRGNLAGTISNITNQQPILGKPLEFSLSGTQTDQSKNFRFNGTIDRINPSAAKDIYSLDFTGYDIKDLKLTSGSLPLTLHDGLADIKAEAVIENGIFDAAIAIKARQTSFKAELDDQADEIYRSLAAAVGRISSFSLEAEIDGSPEDYAISISSDIDRILRQVVNNLLTEYKTRFEQELETAVMQKVSPSLEELDRKLDELEAVDKELADRLRLAEEILGDGIFKGISKGLNLLPF